MHPEREADPAEPNGAINRSHIGLYKTVVYKDLIVWYQLRRGVVIMSS